ncbi:hypothetical protein PTKIN_Ptkin09bG0111300 [Pterospermum kingtungense]
MSAPSMFIFSILLFQLLFVSQRCRRILTTTAGGSWQVLQKSIGVSAMHMQLLRNDRVIVFDQIDFGPSNLPLPKGKCRNDSNYTVLKVDCTAHSVEYNVVNNKFRALMVQSDVWYSSGGVMLDGNLVQTGGFNDGERRVKVFSPCETCDWQEIQNRLAVKRWYATNHILPDELLSVVVKNLTTGLFLKTLPLTSSICLSCLKPMTKEWRTISTLSRHPFCPSILL